MFAESTIDDSTSFGSDTAAIDTMIAALRHADVLTAKAVVIASRLMPAGSIERCTGLSTELLLKLGAHRSGKEARLLAETPATLKRMPATRQAFSRGILSWDEVRLIVSAVRVIPSEQRATVDAVIAAEVARQPDIDPDQLIVFVFDEVARLRSDLLVKREDRRITRSFLSIQPRLDGEGGSLYAEVDAESLATIVEATETFAPRPVDPDDQDAQSRARQRLDGLVNVCEIALAGGAGWARPRPRFLASIDGKSREATVLWRAPGRPGRLSDVATETLLCDAEIMPVVFDGARPIAVGDVIGDPSRKARAALMARDGGCRFPGCSMPAAWTDAHHILGRGPDRTRSIDDLVLLCRRCHRRVHRHRWKIDVRPDGRISFSLRGKTHTSRPHLRCPARK